MSNEARLRRVLEEAVARQVVAGAAASVWTNGEPASRIVCGVAELSTQRAVEETTIFRVASMTKPIVAVGVMQLVDRGLLDIDDPISRYIPAFADTRVCELDLPMEFAFADPSEPHIRVMLDSARARATVEPATRQITIRDLMTHSSGLGQGLGSAGAIADVAGRKQSLAERVNGFALVPGDFQPGTATGYSGLVSFDVLGRVIEILSEVELAAYLSRHIFEPLSMYDTTFLPDEDREKRLAPVYERRDGRLSLMDLSDSPWPLVSAPSTGCTVGSGALYSSLVDYEIFARMLSFGGELDGHRVLSSASVDALRDKRDANSLEFQPGLRWGLGVIVAEGPSARRPIGTWGWSGHFGTHFYVDPRSSSGLVLMASQGDIGGAGSQLSADVESVISFSDPSTNPREARP